MQDVTRWNIDEKKSRLCAHGVIPKWGVNYWETYAPVVNCMNVRALLAIASIHELPIRSIYFVLAFIPSRP